MCEDVLYVTKQSRNFGHGTFQIPLSFSSDTLLNFHLIQNSLTNTTASCEFSFYVPESDRYPLVIYFKFVYGVGFDAYSNRVLITSKYLNSGATHVGNVQHVEFDSSPNVKTNFILLTTDTAMYIIIDGVVVAKLPIPHSLRNVSKCNIVNEKFFESISVDTTTLNTSITSDNHASFREILDIQAPFNIVDKSSLINNKSLGPQITTMREVNNEQLYADEKYLNFREITSLETSFASLNYPLHFSITINVAKYSEYMQIFAFDTGLELFLSSNKCYFLCSRWKDSAQVWDNGMAISLKQQASIIINSELELNKDYTWDIHLSETSFRVIQGSLYGPCKINVGTCLFIGANYHDKIFYKSNIANYIMSNDISFKLRQFKLMTSVLFKK